jgi:hypothetical protein
VITWPHVIQGSDEWFELREWRPTASNASMVYTAGGKDSASWVPYIRQMVDAEVRPLKVREAGKWTGNRHTDRGNETEAAARACFAERVGVDVAEVGFITRDDEIWGCSPDGLVLSRKTHAMIAGLELKCPDGPKHLGHLDAGTLPAEYLQQIHCGMAVTGLNYWYFVSYCDYYVPLILRIERDDYTARMEAAMNRFQDFYRIERLRLLKFKEVRKEPES